MGKPRKAKEKISPGLKLVGKKTRGGIVCYTPGFKRFIRQHKGILTNTFKQIRELNREKPDELSEFKENKQTGIRVSRELTGSYKGSGWNYKVEVLGKKFFVKAKPLSNALDTLEGMKALDSFLKKRKYRIGKFNVRAIKPLLIYERRGSDRTYLVTPFYRKREVKQVIDIGGKKGREVNDALFSFFGEFKRKHPLVGEMEATNAFYQEATNTILLFDIHKNVEATRE